MSTCTGKLKQVGIDLGASTYGTASSSFTRGLAVSSFEVNPAQSVDPLNEIRGTLNTIRTTKGPIARPAKLSFPLDAGDANSASIGDFLASIIGAEAGSIPTAGKYKHRFTIGNVCDPSWLNIWSDKDTTSKQYKGFRPANLKLTVDSKEGQIPVEVDGAVQDESALSTQTLAYSAAPLMVPSMVSTLTLGGSAITDIESVEFAVARGQEGVNTLGTSRNINRLVSGKNFMMMLTMKALQFADETERAKFLANTTSSFVMKILDESGYYLEISAPEIRYQTFEGANLSSEELLRLNIVAIITGSAWTIDLVNAYSKKYTDGTTISA